MQLELALKCTGTSNCKWHGVIGTPKEVLLSGEERLRQSLRSQPVAWHDVSQLGALKAPPGSSDGGFQHIECTSHIRPFLVRKLPAKNEPQGRWSSSPRDSSLQCYPHTAQLKLTWSLLSSWGEPKQGRLYRKSPPQGDHAAIVCTRGRCIHLK